MSRQRSKQSLNHNGRFDNEHQVSRQRQPSCTSSGELEVEWGYELVPQNPNHEFYRDYRPQRTHAQEVKYQSMVIAEATAAIVVTLGNQLYEQRHKLSQTMQQTFRQRLAQAVYAKSKTVVTEATLRDASIALRRYCRSASASEPVQWSMKMLAEMRAGSHPTSPPRPAEPIEPIEDGWEEISNPRRARIFERDVAPSRRLPPATGEDALPRQGFQTAGVRGRNTQRAEAFEDDDEDYDGFFDRDGGGTDIGMPSD